MYFSVFTASLQVGLTTKNLFRNPLFSLLFVFQESKNFELIFSPRLILNFSAGNSKWGQDYNYLYLTEKVYYNRDFRKQEMEGPYKLLLAKPAKSALPSPIFQDFKQNTFGIQILPKLNFGRYKYQKISQIGSTEMYLIWEVFRITVMSS